VVHVHKGCASQTRELAAQVHVAQTHNTIQQSNNLGEINVCTCGASVGKPPNERKLSGQLISNPADFDDPLPVEAELRNAGRPGRNVAAVGTEGRERDGAFMLIRAPNEISRREPGVRVRREPTSEAPVARAVTPAPPNTVVVGNIGPLGLAVWWGRLVQKQEGSARG